MSVELWWLGQAGFRLRNPAGGPKVFVDPFLSPHPNRLVDAPISPDELGRQADIVLCSHEHQDHFDEPALRTAAAGGRAHFELIVPQPLVDRARALLPKHQRVVGAVPDERLVVQTISVHPVLARHGLNASDAYNFGQEPPGGLARYLGYVVDIGGVRIYHAGDCIPYEGQAALISRLRPHVALLPINGRDFYRESERNVVGNMDAREAARLATDIGVELLVPMHWDAMGHNVGFPHQLVEYVVRAHPSLTVAVLGRSGRLIYAPREVD